MPCSHWLDTSIQEFMWNSKSCPEGTPSQNMGTMAAKDAVAMTAKTMNGLRRTPFAISSVLRSTATPPHTLVANKGFISSDPTVTRLFTYQ